MSRRRKENELLAAVMANVQDLSRHYKHEKKVDVKLALNVIASYQLYENEEREQLLQEINVNRTK